MASGQERDMLCHRQHIRRPRRMKLILANFPDERSSETKRVRPKVLKGEHGTGLDGAHVSQSITLI